MSITKQVLATTEEDGQTFELSLTPFRDGTQGGWYQLIRLKGKCRAIVSATDLQGLRDKAAMHKMPANVVDTLINKNNAPTQTAPENATASTESLKPIESAPTPSSAVTTATTTTDTADADWARTSKWLAETACKRNSERKRKGALAAGIKGVPFKNKKELSSVATAIAAGMNRQEDKVGTTSKDKVRAAMGAAIRGA